MTTTNLPPVSTSSSYFELLGVPVSVDDAQLTRRFRELSRMYHPDRWANADPETQTIALDATALLNDAYRTLRDPFLRAEYILRRDGGVSMSDLQKNGRPPQELLVEVMELQEAIMEYQEARLDDDQEVMDRLNPTLMNAQTTFRATYNGLSEQLTSLFTAYNEGTDKAGVLRLLSEVVGTRGYLRRVLTNLDGTLTQ